MEEYIVSARKYRPASFDTVVGQRALTTTLLNAIRTGKLAHAYLFCGPRGVGKTTCARIFAKTINCQNPKADGEACNECESCRAFDEQRSMNIHELDAASNNSVDDIRELIDQVRIPPQGGKYKVFIIDEVHMLSSQAFNAFLKTLEEPPSYVIFILATTEKHKILPTILSRCQVYDFARMTIQNTVDHLAYVAQKEGYTAEPEALNLIAQKADGGMRDALSIFDQMVSFTGGNITYQSTLDNLNVLDTEYYFRLVDYFLNADVESCMLLLNEILGKGFDGGHFIAGLASHMRNLLVSRDAQTLPLLEVSEYVRGKYQDQAQRCHPLFLFRAIKLCNECDINYRQSRNKRLQVELCLIQVAQLNQSDDSDGSGLRPEQKINPIFNQQYANTEKATASAQSQQNIHVSGTENKNVTVPRQSEAKQGEMSGAKESPQTTKPHSLQNLKPSNPKHSKININAISINETPKVEKNEINSEEEGGAFEVIEKGRLTTSNLIQCWQQFATSLQKDEVAMAGRLGAITPQLTSENSFTLIAGSDMLEDALKAKKNDIESFFAKHLEITDVKMFISLQKPASIQKQQSKPQRLKRMKEHNHALERLIEGLDLEVQ